MQELDREDFIAWLCANKENDVGRPGTFFHCPIAEFLGVRAGRAHGVQCGKYGYASLDEGKWNVLPLWAQAFTARAERYAFAPITGAQALSILTGVTVSTLS
ncbi:MAG: hypothetical protein E6J34_14920 [Chloroflexi bacterium]|nr:MAG: hypothetical protein E6J34_14920 [Chloroflexota bacterium]